jgi:hypothetical protein
MSARSSGLADTGLNVGTFKDQSFERSNVPLFWECEYSLG